MITSRSGLATPRWPAQRERPGIAGGRRDPGRTPTLTSTGRVQGPGGIRPGWLRGCHRSRPARRRPPSIHGGIMLSPAPAAMHSWAAALAPGSSSHSSPAPSKMPATSASRSARVPATSRSSVAAAAISGLGWLTPAGMPLGYAVQAGNEQTVRGGSGAIRPSGHQAIRPSGHQARIEPVCDKCKLAKLVFRPRTSRKDRRRKLSRPRRRTVCRQLGDLIADEPFWRYPAGAAWSVVVSPETLRRLPAPQLQNRLLPCR